jgi:hypothetical protein
MSYQQLFSRIQVELDKMARAVRENDEFIAALETIEKPSVFNATIGGIAMNLQGFYTGAERILTAIAKTIDKREPKGDQWHQDLLAQMSNDNGVIRPAVLSPETFDDLGEFMRFRHVVRNAYSHQLDTDSVLENAARLPRCFKNLSDDCAALQRRLNEGIDSGV